jgi:anti-sigma regulatory factor (Ser/Thr protein kinase)
VDRSCDFPADLSSVPAARALVLETLRPEDDADTAALLISELSANAVAHAGTPFTVAVFHDDGWLTVAVHDDDPTLPSVCEDDPWGTHGRGMRLLDCYAAAWGVSHESGDGKTIWFRLPPGGPAEATG